MINKELQNKALEGDMNSQYELANFHANGEGVTVDLKEAAIWYEKAGKQGHVEGMCNYAYLLYTGNQIEQDIPRAVEIFEELSENGSSVAQMNLGIHYTTEDKNTEKALHWLRVAAANGESDAAYNLGIIYFEGTIVEVDQSRAFDYFEQSANKDNPEAIYSLGFCYSKGFGIEKNFNKAVEQYQKAAELGHPNAQYNLGLHYEYGEGGVEEDHDEAIYWYKKASTQGHERAAEAIRLLDNPEPQE